MSDYLQPLRRNNAEPLSWVLNEYPAKLLTLQEVKEYVKLGKSTIYALMKAGEFPQCLKASARSSRWLASDVNKWIATLQEGKSA